MPQHSYHNPGNGYEGTFSRDPNALVVSTSSKREHGKVKGNKREPRVTTVPLSDTRVYASREDYDNGNVSLVIPRKRSHTAAKTTTRKTVTVARVLPEVARFTDTRSLDEIRRVNGL